jgi:hypothetical protein
LESSDKSSASSSPRMLKTKRKMKSDMTQPMRAGRLEKPAAVESGRMSNYSEHEDYFKAVAYMSPLIQSEELDRREKTFGCKSMINFAFLQHKELVESGQHIQVRTKNSIK